MFLRFYINTHALFIACKLSRFRKPTAHSFILGSRASRRPSPKRLMLSTVTRRQTPGGIHIHGRMAITETDWAAYSIFPQDALGTWTPIPKKLRPDSCKIALATPKVNEIRMGEKELGNMYRIIIERFFVDRKSVV